MMIILSWNVGGLNSIPRQKAFHNLVVDHNPDVFIQETKLSVESMVQYASSIWSHGQCQCVGAIGSAGGLAIFWDPWKISPFGLVSSHSALFMVASALDSGDEIMVTNVYVPIDLVGKEEL